MGMQLAHSREGEEEVPPTQAALQLNTERHEGGLVVVDERKLMLKAGERPAAKGHVQTWENNRKII